MRNGQRGKHFQDEDLGTTHGRGHEKVAVTVDDDSDRPDWAMGNNELNPHSKGGGQPADAGDMKGDLYGDVYVVKRDLDPNDGDEDINGEPELDGNGNEIFIGSDGTEICKTEDGDIPEEYLDLVQEVEFSRLSVARSPTAVMEHALDEALTKLGDATSVTLDLAGRLVVDGSTIDSPLENLALYTFLMTTEAEWADYNIPAEVDVAALFGAAADKTTPITVDTLIYENTILGVNGEEYFDFTTFYGDEEPFDYSRIDKYGDATVYWYVEETPGDPTTLVLTEGTVFDAVFGGVDWVDEKPAAAVDDFAQAADDARAVIDFLHSEIVPEIVESVEADMLLV